LGSYANAVPKPPDATFQYVLNAKFSADATDIDIGPAELERGIACHNTQLSESRQLGNDVIADTVTEVLLFFTTAHVVKGQYGDRRLVGRGPGCRHCERRRATDTVGMHGLRDVFQGMSADIVEPNLDLVPDIVIGGAEARGDVDPVAKDIIVSDDNITDVNTDAKFDPLILRHTGILLRHAALDFVGTSHGIDRAGELNKGAVSRILDDTSVMLRDFGIEKGLSKSFQLRQRAFFVDPY
jgi:hypothetical protein